MLLLPVVLAKSAPIPMAVLPPPVVLLSSANSPLAVLALPVVLLKSASKPTAVLSLALLRTSASWPTAVLATAGRVVPKGAHEPSAVLEAPVVLLKSAQDSIGCVFVSPVVLSDRAHPDYP